MAEKGRAVDLSIFPGSVKGPMTVDRAGSAVSPELGGGDPDCFTTEEIYQAYSDYGNVRFIELVRRFHMDRKFVRAEGQYIFDDNGERYYDLLGGFGSLNLGHNHPRILRRLRSLGNIPILLQIRMCPYQAELLSLLHTITPQGLQRTYLGNSGAEATEVAIKLVVAATGKSVLVYTHNSFHGKTLGALAVTGSARYQEPFKDLLAPHIQIPFGDADALEEALEGRDDIAGFIVEPIQGEGGVNVPPADYLERVREICTSHNVPLIVDEIQTGLGRTGRLFESQDIRSDVLLVGKSLSGGLIPIGAMVCTDALWQKAYGTLETCFLHSSTFGGNALACAVGAEAIKTLLEENLAANAASVGDYFLAKLRALQQRHNIVEEVRGKGLLIGLQLKKPFLASDLSERFLGQVVAAALFKDFRIITSFALNRPQVIRLEPSLGFTKTDADYVTAALDDLFSRLPKPEYLLTGLVRDLAPELPDEVTRVQTILGGVPQPVDLNTAEVVLKADALIVDRRLVRFMLNGKRYHDVPDDDNVLAIYHAVTTEENRRAVQACVDASEEFHAVPIDRRHAILRRWQMRIADQFAYLAHLGVHEGFNYKSMLLQVNTIINMLKDERLARFKELLSPQPAPENPSVVYYRQTRPGVVGLAPALNAGVGLSCLGIAAAVSVGKSFIISAGASATIAAAVTELRNAFLDEGIEPRCISMVFSRNRRKVEEWSRFRIVDGEVVLWDDGFRSPGPGRPALDRFCYWGPNNPKFIQAFQEHGIPGSYDMNGSDPVIVDHTADMEGALENTLLRYEASGQFCISPKRAIVHEAVFETFLRDLNLRIRQIRLGLLSDPRTDLMPVYAATDREKYLAAVKEAIEAGAEVYVYGERVTGDSALGRLVLDYLGQPDPNGPFLAPVIVRVKKGQSLMATRDEMFSPLLALYEFCNVDEAIQLANDSDYAIRASVWSRNEGFIDACCKGLDSPSVMVNTPHLWLDVGSSDLGGSKKSGINVGAPGVKHLVLELAGDSMLRKFPTEGAARRFIEQYWVEKGRRVVRDD